MAQDQLKIFCDLDGTLLDVAPRHYRVYSEVTAAFGGKSLPQPRYWELKRKKTLWRELLPMSGIASAALNEFLALFITKIEDNDYLTIDKLFPAALASLDRISQSHECYLVSLRRNHAALLRQVDWLKLAPHFTEVLTGHSETDGSDVKTALIVSRLAGSSGAIIGDTEADIIAGRELGLTTFAVSSGIRDEGFLAALQPDYLLTGIAEVPDSLAEHQD